MNIKMLFASLSFSLIAITAPIYACAEPPAKTADAKAAKDEAPVAKMDEEVAKAIADAEAVRKAAKKVGFEWRDIGKFLKKAKKAAEAGDKEKALKLAAKAKFQGEEGLKQAEIAKNAGPIYTTAAASVPAPPTTK